MIRDLKLSSRKKLVWNFDVPDKLLKWEGVHTVCEESGCPNRLECSQWKTATFLIGGKYCTRNCSFCKVEHGKPAPLDLLANREKEEILQAAKTLNLKFCVVTSVTRDDDPEGLALHFHNICRELKKTGIGVELLIPDFRLRTDLLKIVGNSQPDVIAHNIETVQNLSQKIRPQASYKKSLEVLKYYRVHFPKIKVKTGFMVGLGESPEDIEQTILDIKDTGANILTIGQYLKPGDKQTEVIRFYSESEFDELKKIANKIGIQNVVSGFFIRSSYKAGLIANSAQGEINGRLRGETG